MPSSTSPATIKLKSTLRLLIPRLRMAQKKDTAVSIAQRREMADLLSQSREASARIRVENIIHADITVELMEILELYAELLLARAGLLDQRDVSAGVAGESNTGLEEAAASMIYAAPRLPREVRELGLVRVLLVERFGKEFGVRANENRDDIVPTRVTDKLKVDPPKAELVQRYLEEIARTYKVDWPRGRLELEELRDEVDAEDDAEDDDGVGGGSKEAPLLADPVATPQGKRKVDLGRPFERDELSNATPPSDMAPKSPVSVAPPGPRIDNLSPQVKLPGGDTIKKTEAKSTIARPQSKNAVGGSVPTVDDLAKRFQALKR